jgi:hypothetical protein
VKFCSLHSFTLSSLNSALFHQCSIPPTSSKCIALQHHLWWNSLSLTTHPPCLPHHSNSTQTTPFHHSQHKPASTLPLHHTIAQPFFQAIQPSLLKHNTNYVVVALAHNDRQTAFQHHNNKRTDIHFSRLSIVHAVARIQSVPHKNGREWA